MNEKTDMDLIVGPDLTRPYMALVNLDYAMSQEWMFLGRRADRQAYRAALDAMDTAIRRRRIALNAVACRLESCPAPGEGGRGHD